MAARFEVLLRYRKSMMAGKQDNDKFMATAEPVKLKVPKSVQIEAFAFADNPKSRPDGIAYDKQSQKRAKQLSGDELPSIARKASRILPRV